MTPVQLQSIRMIDSPESLTSRDYELTLYLDQQVVLAKHRVTNRVSLKGVQTLSSIVPIDENDILNLFAPKKGK